MIIRVGLIVPLIILGTASFGQKPKQVADKYYQKGESAFAVDNWSKSELYFDSCLQIDALHFDARYSRAIARENQNIK